MTIVLSLEISSAAAAQKDQVQSLRDGVQILEHFHLGRSNALNVGWGVGCPDSRITSVVRVHVDYPPCSQKR